MPEQATPRRVVAITGTSEFLGSHLIGRLERDPEVQKILAIDVREPTAFGRKTVFGQVDLTAPDAGGELADVLREHRADVLVHLAFLSHPIHDTSYAHELQVIGTMHTLHAAASARVTSSRSSRKAFIRSRRPMAGNPAEFMFTSRN